MPDYKSMYTLLCKAVDDAIDPRLYLLHRR